MSNQPTVLFVGADAKYMMDFRAPLMAEFLDKGYRVVVIATVLGGFDEHRLSDLDIEFIPWTLSKSALNPAREVRALLKLWTTLRTMRCQIVFAHTIKPVIYAMILARCAGIPRRAAMIPGLGYAFTEGRELRRKIVSKLARAAYALAFRCSSVVLFQNGDDRAELLATGILSEATRTAVVNGSGVDMDRYSVAPFPETPMTFLMVARLIRDKGVYEFVDAARRVKKQVPGTRFVLVGAPDANPTAIQQRELEAWRSEGVIEVRGYMAEPQSAYAACHVFVLPSYYREGTPRTNLEAMATGRPVITTDMPGCRDTVVDGLNGLLVPPRDPVALADAMLMLTRDPALVRRMGDAGRRICAERYELTSVARTTMAHVEGAAEQISPLCEPFSYEAGVRRNAPGASAFSATSD